MKRFLFVMLASLACAPGGLLADGERLAQDDGAESALAASLDQPMGETPSQALDGEVEDLKQQVLELNRELFVLEEELLFPANTQVAVFLSMDVGTFFALDSVELKLGDKSVTSYLYTEREAQALYRGGVQRLFVGNLPAGEHELVAFFTGKGPHGRDYRRGANLVFEKSLGPKFIELRIDDATAKLQPEFTVKEWD